MRSNPCKSRPRTSRLSKEDHRLVLDHLDLARRLARKHARLKFGNHDDLLGVAHEALVNAAVNFRHDRCAFSTYAYRRIVGSMLDYSRRNTRARNKWSRAPWLSHIPASGEFSGRPHHCFDLAENRVFAPLASFCELRPDLKFPDPERAAMFAELRRAVLSLPSRQKHLLIRHYFDGEELALAAHEIGISKTTSSTDLAAAIATLRRRYGAPTSLPSGGRHTIRN